MIKRFTVRLDEELSGLLSYIKDMNVYNLSALAREALRDKLSTYINIDNSMQLHTLKKDEVR